MTNRIRAAIRADYRYLSPSILETGKKQVLDLHQAGGARSGLHTLDNIDSVAMEMYKRKTFAFDGFGIK